MSQCRQKLKAEGKPYPRSNCAICGQWAACWKECDEKLQAAPAPPQPIYDEAKERQLFEAFASTNYVVPPGVGHLFVRAEVGEGYRLSNINHAWHGWLSCAKSRAKAGEDE